jgi:hypothetical protein
MMSNHIDARSWAVPTLQNDLNAVTVSITDYYPDRLLGKSILESAHDVDEYLGQVKLAIAAEIEQGLP